MPTLGKYEEHELPAEGQLYRHKNGHTYVVLSIANFYTERPDEYPVTVIYRHVHTGAIWCRPMYRWVGSFTLVTDRVL